jgi:hypothetical protein
LGDSAVGKSKYVFLGFCFILVWIRFKIRHRHQMRVFTW